MRGRAEGRWLCNFLAESRFKQFVQPVVFSGWYVEKADMKSLGAWVLEPMALDAFVDSRPVVRSQDQMRAMAPAPRKTLRRDS